MSWSEHIDTISTKINQRIGMIKRIRHLLPLHAKLTLYNCLIIPLFDYGDTVWGTLFYFIIIIIYLLFFYFYFFFFFGGGEYYLTSKNVSGRVQSECYSPRGRVLRNLSF